MAVRCVLNLNVVIRANHVVLPGKRMLNGQRMAQMVNLRKLHCYRSDRFHLRCSSSKPLLIETTMARLIPLRNTSGGGSKEQIPNPSEVWCAQNIDAGSQRTKQTEAEQITFDYYKGFPRLTIPLPSRKERCRFTLKPVSNTIGDLSAMVKAEDPGIDRVVISSKDGVRIASSNSIELLLEEEEFYITINDTSYKINVPSSIRQSFSKDSLEKLSDVRMIVSQLHETLHIRDYQIHREQELKSEQEKIRLALEPYEELRNQLEKKAELRTSMLPWVILFLISGQCGIIARCTWWEYSWDIMEPITYFSTAFSLMLGYAYYCITKQEFILRDVTDRRHLVVLHNKMRKCGFDLQQYNALKEQQAKVQTDLERLDPVRFSNQSSMSSSLPPRLGYVTNSTSDTFQADKPFQKIGYYVKLLLDKSRKLK